MSVQHFMSDLSQKIDSPRLENHVNCPDWDDEPITAIISRILTVKPLISETHTVVIVSLLDLSPFKAQEYFLRI